MNKRELFLYKDRLNRFSIEVNKLTKKYMTKINLNFSKNVIDCVNMIYEAMRFQVDCEIGKYRQDEKESKKNYGMTKLKQCLEISDEEEISYFRLYELAEYRARKLLAFLEEYKRSIGNLYRQYVPYLWHVSSIYGLSFIRPSMHKENMYYNEICNAVFATSSYEEILLYMGRVFGGEMAVINNLCFYKRNPYYSWDNTKICLKDKADIYYLKAAMFEPVIDFVIKDTGELDLIFGHEWVCRKEVPVYKIEEITDIPTEEMRAYHLFYGLKDICLAPYIDYFRWKNDEESKERYLHKLIIEKVIAYVNLRNEEVILKEKL